MRIGVFFPTKEHGPLHDMIERFRSIDALGLDSGWLPQSAGFDAITAWPSSAATSTGSSSAPRWCRPIRGTP